MVLPPILEFKSLTRLAAMSGIVALAAGCSSPPQPPPAPPATPAPIAVSTPAPSHAQSSDQDWNIFPDPTTGKIDIYHKGEYVGEITGDEPPEQDPPVPHKPENPIPDY